MVSKTGQKPDECCHFCKSLEVRYEAAVWVAAPNGIKQRRKALVCEKCVGRAPELARASEKELISFQGRKSCGNQN